MNILFNKIRNVKSPNRAYGTGDAIDFFVPEYSAEFYDDLMNKSFNREYCDCTVSPDRDSMTITVAPHGRVNIPSGIRVIIGDPNTCLLAVNKSGIAANKSLILGAVLIDHDYEGEIHLNVINTSDDPVQIKTGEKLVQFMHLPVLHTAFQEVCAEDFDKLSPKSARGSGGFGSSNV